MPDLAGSNSEVLLGEGERTVIDIAVLGRPVAILDTACRPHPVPDEQEVEAHAQSALGRVVSVSEQGREGILVRGQEGIIGKSVHRKPPNILTSAAVLSLLHLRL